MVEIQKILLSGVQESLAQSLKLKELKELQNLNEVMLPEEVFSEVKEAVRDTQKDFCERWIDFSFREGSQIVRRHKVGPEFNLESLSGEVSIDQWEALRENFIGEPGTIFFHTHPNLDQQYLKNKNVSGFRVNSQTISIEKSLLLWRNYVPFFSAEDIGFIATHNRAVRSALLGTELGYIWIININFNIPKWLTMALDFPEKKYSRIIRTADRVLYKYLEDPVNNSQSLTEYNELRRQALLRFCKAYGFIAFSNDNFLNPILKRIDQSTDYQVNKQSSS